MTAMRLVLWILLAQLVAGAAFADDSGALDSIRKSGVIRLGYTESSPPFAFRDDKGTPVGYSVDLCAKVAEGIRDQLQLEDLKVEWVPLTLQNRLTAVREHEVHLECGTTTWTLSRQQSVDFSLMTFVDGGTVLVRGNTDILRLADLAGKRIAVVPGTTTEPAIKASLQQQQIAAEVMSVSSHDKGVELLTTGKVDGYASDRLVLLGLGLFAKDGKSLRVLDEDFSVEPYALALPRGDYALRLAVNRVLAGLYRTGGILEIYDRWFGPLGKPSVLLTALYYLQAIPE